MKLMPGPFKRWVPQLLDFSWYLSQHVYLKEITTVNVTFIIFEVIFPHWCAYAFVSEWSPYMCMDMFINMLAYNHAIKLVSTSAGMRLSTLDRWTIEINVGVWVDVGLI